MGLLDFTSQFNTDLSPEQEAKFQAWANSQNKLRDLQDYDLRGFWAGQGQVADNGHSSDQFKKPNHPTFSDQSIYNGSANPAGGRCVGGTWDQANGLDQRTTPYTAQEAYRRLAGEAEARATQARMNMTPAERRATFPLDSYDVPINQLIVR